MTQTQIMADLMGKDAQVLLPADGRHLETGHHHEVVIDPPEPSAAGVRAGPVPEEHRQPSGMLGRHPVAQLLGLKPIRVAGTGDVVQECAPPFGQPVGQVVAEANTRGA